MKLSTKPQAKPETRGRKPLPPDERADCRVTTRCTPIQSAAYRSAAEASGLSLSAWITATLDRAAK